MQSLSNLTPKVHRKAKIRVGRGSGSGKGSYSGRGIKGQRARTGGKHKGGHAGKKMPLFVSQLPKNRGFHSGAPGYAVVNLDDLSAGSRNGTVTPATLRRAHRISDRTVRVKVLGGGNISEKLAVHAHAFSVSAKNAIIKAGGTVRVLGERSSPSS